MKDSRGRPSTGSEDVSFKKSTQLTWIASRDEFMVSVDGVARRGTEEERIKDGRGRHANARLVARTVLDTPASPSPSDASGSDALALAPPALCVAHPAHPAHPVAW